MTVFVRVAAFEPDDPDDVVVAVGGGLLPRADAIAWAREVLTRPGRTAYRAWFECYSFDGFEWVPTGEIGEMYWDEEQPRWFGGE